MVEIIPTLFYYTHLINHIPLELHLRHTVLDIASNTNCTPQLHAVQGKTKKIVTLLQTHQCKINKFYNSKEKQIRSFAFRSIEENDDQNRINT